MSTADKIMALVTDFGVESLRLGSYERKDSYENSARASWQTIALREKREAARQAVREEIAALVRDAERYRWLRNEADYLRLPQGSPQVLMTDEWGVPISTGKEAYPQKDGLDAAIDTARQEKQP